MNFRIDSYDSTTKVIWLYCCSKGYFLTINVQ
eukprot:UN02455